MEKIGINKKFEFVQNKSSFGSLKVENVCFTANALEDYIYKYILNEENLKFIFCEKNYNNSKKNIMLRRFVPPYKPDDISKYVDEEIEKHNSFYSFLAEALLPIVYRDVYGCKLSAAAVDEDKTLIDTETGADACLFDKKNKTIILGEAKFYKDLNDGFNKIIKNFSEENSLFNKIDNLIRKTKNSSMARSFLIKCFGERQYEKYTFDEFISLRFGFFGFVLHELGNTNIEIFDSSEFYDKYDISDQKINYNLKKSFSLQKTLDCYVVMFHFFIDSKKNLIKKTIEYAYKLLEEQND